MEAESLQKPEVITKSKIEGELEFDSKNDTQVIEQEEPELARQADEIVNKMLAIDTQDLVEQQRQATAVSQLGAKVQAELAKQSQMLSVPMTTLVHEAEDGGKVANSLLSLQEQVNNINPNRVDFSMGTIRRILARIPGVGTPLARWFAKYQAVGNVIQDIVNSLKDGKSQLSRDNTTLQDDQRRMRELTFKLQEYIKLGQLLDQKLSKAIETQVRSDDPRLRFLQEEVLFPLRQRVMDLQQQLAVNMQGVLATELIVRNNKELIKGVERALNVTITALNTAATLQVALVRQKKVMEGVDAVTKTTNDLIVETAETLKTQGVAIQKQAASLQLDITALKRAFVDIDTALNDISKFRREALPQMAQSIVEMNDLSTKMEESVQKMESGNKVSDDFGLEIIDK